MLKAAGRAHTRSWLPHGVAVALVLTALSLIGTAGPASAAVPTDCYPADPTFPGRASEVCGEIHDEWLRVGGLYGDFGVPTSPQFETTGQVLLDPKTGAGQHFVGGSIYWTAEDGAHAISGPTRDRYAETGWENGPLGYPTSTTFQSVGGGQGTHFEHGSIYWSPLTGAHIVSEPALAVWAAAGYEKGYLGYPVTDQVGVFDGQLEVVHFRGGDVYVNGAQASLELPTSVAVPDGEPTSFTPDSLPGDKLYSFDFDLDRTGYLTLPSSVDSIFAELRRCFNCSFPVFNAPTDFPDQGDVLPLTGCRIWVLEGTTCSAPVSVYSNGRTYIRYSAVGDHFDGADSTVTFTFYKKDSSLWMNVTGFVVNPKIPKQASESGAYNAWFTYAERLGRNLFLHQCGGSADC